MNVKWSNKFKAFANGECRETVLDSLKKGLIIKHTRVFSMVVNLLAEE